MRRAVLALAILVGCGPTGGDPVPSAPSERPPAPGSRTSSGGQRFLVAVGDIACAPGEAVTRTTCHHAGTAALLERGGPLAGRGLLGALLLGDVQYETGSVAEYASFQGTWGTVLARSGARVLPVAGNHEYGNVGPAPAGCQLEAGGRHACGFAAYFSERTGLLDDGDANYTVTFEAAAHPLVVVVVDVGPCDVVPERCGPNGPVVRFLRRSLADRRRNDPSACTIAAWHHARWSELGHGDLDVVDAVWRSLFDVPEAQRPDLVLNGHDHLYERYPPLDQNGRPAPGGVPEIVVGTGGREVVGGLGGLGPRFGELEAIDFSNFGVLRVGWDGTRPELTTAFVTEGGARRDTVVHPCRS